VFAKHTGFCQQKNAEDDEKVVHPRIRARSREFCRVGLLGQVQVWMQDELFVVTLRQHGLCELHSEASNHHQSADEFVGELPIHLLVDRQPFIEFEAK